MDELEPGLWRTIGRFIPREQRSIVDIIQEETIEEQDARYRYQYFVDTGVLNSGAKIFEDSSWQHNYEQVRQILEVLGNRGIAERNEYIDYVFGILPYLFPEYMEGMDRDLVFSLDEAPVVFGRIGNNLLSSLNSRYRIRLELGLKQLYRFYQSIDNSVINYFLLRLGSRILRYGPIELLQFASDRDIPIKRIRWNIQQ